MDERTLLLRELLLPHGIDPAEALEDDAVRLGLIVDRRGDQWRVVTGRPLMPTPMIRPMTDFATAVTQARGDWLQFLSRVMRDRSVEAQTGDRSARPAWSILASPVTRAAAALAGISGHRLAERRVDDGAPAFPKLGETEERLLPDTPWYRRDGVAREGDDHLHGQYLLNQADHVVRHSLQLVADARLPIRSVSDLGSTTIVEVRRIVPDTACQALVGRPLSDLLGLPGFTAGTPAGDSIVVGARSNASTGCTGVSVAKRYLPLADPPEGTDMRWLALTPSWR